MSLEAFKQLIMSITADIVDKPLDSGLQEHLLQHHAPGSVTFDAIRQACEQGIKEGWICQHEAGGIRYSRVFKPDSELHGFSVDVVLMKDVKGPHHRHPLGEIDMIIPLDADAKFDGHGAGWCVYPPDSAHHPTVTEGEAIVLYLLPKGAIEFTKTPS